MRSTCGTICLLVLGLALNGAGAPAADGTADSGPKHWAFVRAHRPKLPAVADARWAKNPIDCFVKAQMDAAGVKPVAAADRPTLIRRLFLDLTGLPPSPEEVKAFVADQSPDAVTRLVDRLLASPHYGERWARHWLDVVRYADTNGYERDGAKPSVWRYRDYVIDAFNRDKPYDVFVAEQLAGDEVEGSDACAQIATTFLRLGTWDDEPADPGVDRYDQLDDVLGTTATAFLGVTLRCARCHDHKFEPFTQADYYRMLAIFEPLKRPQDSRADLDRPVGTESELATYRARLAQADTEFASTWARIEGLIKPEIDRVLAARENPKDRKAAAPLSAWARASVAAFRTAASKRTEAQWVIVRRLARQLVAEASALAPKEVKAALEPLDGRLGTVLAERPAEPPHAYIWSEDGPKAPATHILRRGDPARPGAIVEPAVPSILGKGPKDPPRPKERSTGRRLWLARWLTAPENPLTARIIVNRIWQFHFGEGLVSSSNDFGVMGEAPSHPDLLDWLACELVASGWKLKPLTRMIVLSQTYQLASTIDPKAAGHDADNKLLWRWRERRLEAEAVRDSILAVGGGLNSRMAGPGVYPTLPQAVLAGQSRPGDGWGSSDEHEQSRRSVYIFAKRSLGVPELELLDTPDNTSSCERRVLSTTGPQALTFLNGSFIHEQARQFAARLAREAGDAAGAQVRRAFELALSRAPRDDELQAAIQFLDRQECQIQADQGADATAARAGDARRRALEALCLVVLNINEFVSIR
jgi:hypothetical protein